MMQVLFITLIIITIGSALILFATHNNWMYLRIFCYKEYKAYKFALENVNECKYDFSIDNTDHFLLYDNYTLTTYHNGNSVGIFKKVNNNWECVFSSYFKNEAKELYNKLVEIKQKEFTKDICEKIPEMIYYLQCADDKGRGFWLFKADDDYRHLATTSNCMYFMYNSSRRYDEINQIPVDDNSGVINKIDLVYKNTNRAIIMTNSNVLTMRPATSDEIELFRCSELLECK